MFSAKNPICLIHFIYVDFMMLPLIYFPQQVDIYSQSIEGALKTLVASGTDTYTVSETLPAGYVLNERFIVRFTNANTGAATLNRNGLGAKSIVKNGSTALGAGDIVAGQAYIIQYNGTNYQLLGSIFNTAVDVRYLQNGASTTLSALTTFSGSATNRLNLSVPIILGAGAAAVNSAPLKFTSGTNLTTPEAGATEFDGTNLFFSPTTSARLAVAMNAKAATSATTGTMTTTLTNLSAITITPTGACTFNASGGIAGQKCAFIITTSGTTAFTLTWGTNFKTTTTLSTGTVTAKTFTVEFVYDGTNWCEVARTTAM